MKDPDFDKKLKNINKNELNELSEKVKVWSTKGYNFLLGRTCFTGNDGYQNC